MQSEIKSRGALEGKENPQEDGGEIEGVSDDAMMDQMEKNCQN